LKRRLEEARALRRRLALEELGQLQALAERFRPFGGEAVLKAIEAERQKPLPDPAPIARALQALKRRLEAKRQELGTRLAAFFRRYAPLEGLKSDTQRRIRPLVEFLRPAQKALDRLGPRGVLEVERALAQAEEALKELEKEKEAADRLLKELGQEDLEALLSSLEAPGGERPDLSPLRLPGVKALGLLDDPLPLPAPSSRPSTRPSRPWGPPRERPWALLSSAWAGAIWSSPPGGGTRPWPWWSPRPWTPS